MIESIDPIPPQNIYRVDPSRPADVPFYEALVPAGFPSPAETYVERRLNLHDLCVRYPDATYFVRVAGESMIEAHILPGSILVVDSAQPLTTGAIIVAWLNGECCVKYFVPNGSMITLHPANPNYPPMYVHPDRDQFRVLGCVTFILSKPQTYVCSD